MAMPVSRHHVEKFLARHDRSAPETKWGPASLPVPTSAQSSDPRSCEGMRSSARRIPFLCLMEGRGQGFAQGSKYGLLTLRRSYPSVARRSLSRVPGIGLQRPVFALMRLKNVPAPTIGTLGKT